MVNQRSNDILPYSLAVITFIGFLLIIFTFVTADDKETVNRILIGFIAWMGTIIGFYFGHRPVTEMTRQVERTSGEVERQKAISREGNTDLEDAISELKELKQKSEKLRDYVDELTQKVE